MPFWIYSATALPSGMKRYIRNNNVKFAGNRSGLIYAACRSKLNINSNTEWTVSADEMLVAGGYTPNDNAIFSDTAPSRNGEVNVFKLLSVSGLTYCEWTPIMLHMQVTLKHAVPIGTEDAHKKKFDSDNNVDEVYTFLYLQGGYIKGSWNWGQVGLVNGPLLWPDALDFFKKITP